MKIGGYLATSLIEWPGKIVAVIWTIGCNFRCPFCDNSQLVIGPFPQLIDEEEIFSDLIARRQWLDGLAISGGEPTLQPDLADFCRRAKQLGLLVMIETNGSQPQVIKELISGQLVDFWAIDYKTSWDQYPDLVGVKELDLGAKIKESLKLIFSSGRPVEIRTTLVPRIHSEEKLIQMARELADFVARWRSKRENLTWRWQNFQPVNTIDPSYQNYPIFSEKELNQLKEKILREKIKPVFRVIL